MYSRYEFDWEDAVLVLLYLSLALVVLAVMLLAYAVLSLIWIWMFLRTAVFIPRGQEQKDVWRIRFSFVARSFPDIGILGWNCVRALLIRPGMVIAWTEKPAS